jgi:hypothetical protein
MELDIFHANVALSVWHPIEGNNLKQQSFIDSFAEYRMDTKGNHSSDDISISICLPFIRNFVPWSKTGNRSAFT